MNTARFSVGTKLGRGGSWWIAVAFFLISVAPGMWLPCLPNVLDTRGMKWVLPYAFAVAPAVALISPMIFGSMADYRFSAQKLMGVLSIVGAGFLAMAFISIDLGWGPWAYLAFQTMNALTAAPMWSLLSTTAFANLDNADKSFPLYRVWGTFGWIAAGVTVSLLGWDSSAMTGVAAAGVRVLLGFVCFLMPDTPPQGDLGHGKPSWKKYLGLDALVMFKNPSMRVFLLTSVLFAIPLGAFYMYTPILLRTLADPHPAASMTLGQLTEILAMLMLSGMLARGKLKWVLVASLFVGLLRYILFAIGSSTGGLIWIWLGIAMHGPCYTFFYVTGQMLVDKRVRPAMRGQAQALLSTLAGVGGFAGSLLCGWYFGKVMGIPGGWTIYWLGLAVAVLGCGVYFTLCYKRE